MSLRSVLKSGVALVILSGLLSAAWPASAAQGNRVRRARASAATTSTPVDVPRIKATSNVNATSVPSLGSAPATNAPTQTPAPTPRQTPTPQPATPAGETLEAEDEVVRVTSNLVVVPVSVTNAAGEPVQGLKLED